MCAFNQQEAKVNAEQMSETINKLADLIGQKEFVDHAKEVQQLFNTLRPLTKDDRESLWSKYQEYWDQHKKERAKQEGRKEKSEQSKKEIKGDMWIDTSVPSKSIKADWLQLLMAAGTGGLSLIFQHQDDWENMGAVIANAKGKLDEIENNIREDRQLLPRDRHELFEKLHELRDKLYHERNRAWDILYDKAADLYNETSNSIDSLAPKEASGIFKTNQTLVMAMYLRPDDKQKLRRWFEDLWNKLQARFDDQRKVHEQRQAEWKEKQAEWRERQEAGLERLLEAKEKLENYIEKLERNIDVNKEKLESAWSDKFTELAQGWIDEGEEKLSEAEESLRNLKNKIEDAENRLRR